LDLFIGYFKKNRSVRNLGNQANEFGFICVGDLSAREHPPRSASANDAGHMRR
jgi:hypothetical protein